MRETNIVEHDDMTVTNFLRMDSAWNVDLPSFKSTQDASIILDTLEKSLLTL